MSKTEATAKVYQIFTFLQFAITDIVMFFQSENHRQKYSGCIAFVLARAASTASVLAKRGKLLEIAAAEWLRTIPDKGSLRSSFFFNLVKVNFRNTGKIKSFKKHAFFAFCSRFANISLNEAHFADCRWFKTIKIIMDLSQIVYIQKNRLF